MYTPSFDYFIEIAKTLNFSSAAKKVHVSQQNLSSYMQRLESYYGVQMVERKPTMRLTKAGKMTLEAAEKIDDILNELSVELSKLNRGVSAPIVIGLAHPMDSMMLEAFPIMEFCKKYPDISFVITNGTLADQRENLHSGKVDIFAGAYQTSYDRQHSGAISGLLKEFNVIDLFDETECIVISDGLMRKYFDDSYPQCIEQFTLGAEVKDFVHIPSVMHEQCPLRNKIDKYCAENKLKLNILVESSDSTVTKAFIKSGLAYGLLSSNAVRDMIKEGDADGIYAFPIIKPDVWRKIGVFYRKQDEYMDYFKALINEIKEKNKPQNS